MTKTKTLFHGRGVAAFAFDDGTVNDRPINVYPAAHDSSDSISICWSMTVEDAERLAGEIRRAIEAVRAAGTEREGR